MTLIRELCTLGQQSRARQKLTQDDVMEKSSVLAKLGRENWPSKFNDADNLVFADLLFVRGIITRSQHTQVTNWLAEEYLSRHTCGVIMA